MQAHTNIPLATMAPAANNVSAVQNRAPFPTATPIVHHDWKIDTAELEDDDIASVRQIAFAAPTNDEELATALRRQLKSGVIVTFLNKYFLFREQVFGQATVRPLSDADIEHFAGTDDRRMAQLVRFQADALLTYAMHHAGHLNHSHTLTNRYLRYNIAAGHRSHFHTRAGTTMAIGHGWQRKRKYIGFFIAGMTTISIICGAVAGVLGHKFEIGISVGTGLLTLITIVEALIFFVFA